MADPFGFCNITSMIIVLGLIEQPFPREALQAHYHDHQQEYMDTDPVLRILCHQS